MLETVNKDNDVNLQKDRIAIIDLDSILFAAAWGNKIYLGDDEEGNPIYQRDEAGRLEYTDKTEEEIERSFKDILIDILLSTESTGYIAYVKGKNTGSHRYKANPEYKSNRPKESPTWWEYTKNLVIDKYNAIEVNNIEVDDAVNIARLQVNNSFIVAIDKDLLNLEGTHYNWRTNEWVTVSAEDAFLAFWRDMIVGQSGDGIRGLPGKGQAFYRDKIKKVAEGLGDIDYIPGLVLNAYIETLGEDEGVKHFYSTYQCLKILTETDVELKIEIYTGRV